MKFTELTIEKIDKCLNRISHINLFLIVSVAYTYFFVDDFEAKRFVSIVIIAYVIFAVITITYLGYKRNKIIKELTNVR